MTNRLIVPHITTAARVAATNVIPGELVYDTDLAGLFQATADDGFTPVDASLVGTYSTSVTYQINGVIRSGAELYVSIQNNNLNNALTDATYWLPVGGSSSDSLGQYTVPATGTTPVADTDIASKGYVDDRDDLKQNTLNFGVEQDWFASVTYDPLDGSVFFGEITGGFEGIRIRDLINASTINRLVIAGVTHTFDGNLVATVVEGNVNVTGGSSYSPQISSSSGRVISGVFSDVAVSRDIVPDGNIAFSEGPRGELVINVADSGELNVLSDWAATTGDAAILNKPSMSAAGVYTEINMPDVNLVTDDELTPLLTAKQDNISFSRPALSFTAQVLIDHPGAEAFDILLRQITAVAGAAAVVTDVDVIAAINANTADLISINGINHTYAGTPLAEAAFEGVVISGITGITPLFSNFDAGTAVGINHLDSTFTAVRAGLNTNLTEDADGILAIGTPDDFVSSIAPASSSFLSVSEGQLAIDTSTFGSGGGGLTFNISQTNASGVDDVISSTALSTATPASSKAYVDAQITDVRTLAISAVGILAFDPARAVYGMEVVVGYDGDFWEVAVSNLAFDIYSTGVTTGPFDRHSAPSDASANWLRHSFLEHVNGDNISRTVRDHISLAHGLDIPTSAGVAEYVTSSVPTVTKTITAHTTGPAVNLDAIVVGNTQNAYVGGGLSNSFEATANFSTGGLELQTLTTASPGVRPIAVGDTFSFVPDTAPVLLADVSLAHCTRIIENRPTGNDFYIFTLNDNALIFLQSLVSTANRPLREFEGTTHLDWRWFNGSEAGDIAFYPIATADAATLGIAGVDVTVALDGNGNANLTSLGGGIATDIHATQAALDALAPTAGTVALYDGPSFGYDFGNLLITTDQGQTTAPFINGSVYTADFQDAGGPNFGSGATFRFSLRRGAAITGRLTLPENAAVLPVGSVVRFETAAGVFSDPVVVRQHAGNFSVTFGFVYTDTVGDLPVDVNQQVQVAGRVVNKGVVFYNGTEWVNA